MGRKHFLEPARSAPIFFRPEADTRAAAIFFRPEADTRTAATFLRPEADTRTAGVVRPRGEYKHKDLQPGGRHILLTLRYH